jgi:hypothetical protein
MPSRGSVRLSLFSVGFFFNYYGSLAYFQSVSHGVFVIEDVIRRCYVWWKAAAAAHSHQVQDRGNQTDHVINHHHDDDDDDIDLDDGDDEPHVDGDNFDAEDLDEKPRGYEAVQRHKWYQYDDSDAIIQKWSDIFDEEMQQVEKEAQEEQLRLARALQQARARLYDIQVAQKQQLISLSHSKDELSKLADENRKWHEKSQNVLKALSESRHHGKKLDADNDGYEEQLLFTL